LQSFFWNVCRQLECVEYFLWSATHLLLNNSIMDEIKCCVNWRMFERNYVARKMFHNFLVNPNPPSFPLSPHTNYTSHCTAVSNSRISLLGFSCFFLLFYRALSLTFKTIANIAATSVIRHSLNRGNWRDIGSYIGVSGRLAVTYVITHSIGRTLWRHIYAYIAVSGHFIVMCVI
jgi:hypothetical protein